MSEAQLEFEPAVARALERYAPLGGGDGDWDTLLDRARRPDRRRRFAFAFASVAAAAVVVATATPLRGAIANVFSDFSAWIAGTPGTPASEEEQRAFDEANARSWVAFPGSPKLRQLIHLESDGVAYDLVGFRSGGSLCIRVTAAGAADDSRLTCAPIEELRQDDVPVRVLLADWGVGRGDKEATIGFDTYHSSRAQITAGIAADGVNAIDLSDDQGRHRVAVQSNAFLYVAERPEVGQRVSDIRAEVAGGRSVDVPFTTVAWGPAPGFGGAAGEPQGPTKVDRVVNGGTVAWIDRRENRGEELGARLRERVRSMRFSELDFARLLTPDPGSAKRIAVTVGRLEHPPPNFAARHQVVCAWVIEHDGAAGGGCGTLAELFARTPFTGGYSVSGAGDQYATFAGLASDDVDRMEIFTATGNEIDVPLRDNVFLAEVALARLPVKMVAYDDGGRVIGIETTPREELPQHPLPGEIVHLTATADGIGTLELRANKTSEGGGCWAVRGTGAVAVNAGACVGTTWTYAPLRLGTVPDPPVFVYGRVRGDVQRLTLRYADGGTSEVSPRDGGYVLIALPANRRSSEHQLVEVIGRNADGRVIARMQLQPR
jgi:hypothetical protein